MHIPDGFISPKMYVPAYVLAGGAWAYALRRVRDKLDEEAIPRVAVMTALSFVLMMLTFPLPGGTSVYGVGVGLLAVMFGVWTAFLALSLVLLLQAVLLGIGRVTSLPVNALALGLAGSAIAAAAFVSLRRFGENVALFVAGWLSIALPALLLAVALGIQSTLARTADGTPLFFPFGLSVTVPAMVVPHAVVGMGEGLLTVLVYRFVAGLREKREDEG